MSNWQIFGGVLGIRLILWYIGKLQSDIGHRKRWMPRWMQKFETGLVEGDIKRWWDEDEREEPDTWQEIIWNLAALICFVVIFIVVLNVNNLFVYISGGIFIMAYILKLNKDIRSLQERGALGLVTPQLKINVAAPRGRTAFPK